MLAIVSGCPPDEGVMVETGLAIAGSKPVFLFRDDFRRCADSDDHPFNFMAFVGFPETGWRDYRYGAVAGISDPGKAPVRWLNGVLP